MKGKSRGKSSHDVSGKSTHRRLGSLIPFDLMRKEIKCIGENEKGEGETVYGLETF